LPRLGTFMEVLARAYPTQRHFRNVPDVCSAAMRAPHARSVLPVTLLLLAWGGFPAKKPPSQLDLARHRIKHVVFIVKENRTFDTMFGTFPGADGARRGRTCRGRLVPLTQAADRTDGANHSFVAGIWA